MRSRLLRVCCLLPVFSWCGAGAAAPLVVDFEDLALSPGTFNNGSNGAGGFVSQQTKFNNNYNSTFGSWNAWAYSNVTDVSTAGFTNQYSAYKLPAGGGANGTTNFAVAFCDSFDPLGTPTIELPSGFVLDSLHVTNDTYAALSMRNGDSFAKKFGGPTGNDPDWFLLTINGLNGSTPVGTVNFYLADYRFADNGQDYVVSDWTEIDLSSLSAANKLTFSVSSTDVDPVFGMNTPAYFAIDNLVLQPVPEPAGWVLAALGSAMFLKLRGKPAARCRPVHS
jgi:hypothetical protein